MNEPTSNEESEILEEISNLRSRIEAELRSDRLRGNDRQYTSDENGGGEFPPLDEALEDALRAEIATTVKSSLPKFFNPLLRKQNEVNRALIAAIRHLAETHQETNSKWRDLTRSLSSLQQRVNALTHPPSPTQSEESSSANDKSHELDFAQFYLAFENEFRGSFESVLQRLRVHIPIAHEARHRTSGQPFRALDLGCGRGEWLSLLRDEELEAEGVDCNQQLLRKCQEQDLSVKEGDALETLRDAADESLSLLTAFHLIEHLDFQTQLSFVFDAFRVLRPGGILIAETPNVRNLDVGASGFFHDPTHIRPVPWPLAKFMAEHVGFVPAEIRFLNPDSSHSSEEGEQKNEVEERLHGPRDYALVAYKA